MQGARRGRRRSWALACALAVGLVLGACDPGEDATDPETTDGDTSTAPVESTSASDEPSTDAPTPPDLDQPVPPEEMSVDDRAGAAAAAVFFFEVLDYAFATGDTRLLESISSTDCNYCTARIEAIDAMVEAGGWKESPGSQLTDIRVEYPEAESTEYVVRFVLTIPETVIHVGDGTTQVSEASTLPRAALGATWVDGRFVVSGVNPDTDE